METRKIGRLEVPIVGMGCNNFGMRIEAGEADRVVGEALDRGVTFFDTADVYGQGKSEEFLGKALGSRRDEAVIATKFAGQMGEDPEARGGDPKWIARAVDDSLRRLATDRIDLYQMHGPDPDVPIEETLGALNELVDEGKVLEIGCSNFSGAQIDEATTVSADRGWAAFASAQNHYSLLHREPEPEVTGACERHGMALLPYFPLASGLLTGKYRRAEELPEGTRLHLMKEFMPERAERFLNDRNWDVVEELRAFCEQRGHTMLELAFSWLAAQPSVASVIAGATKPEQVRANAEAASWKLSDADLAELDRITGT